MHWQLLEDLIHDHQLRLTKGEVERRSTELLQSLDQETKALHGAKIAYTLALLQLKAKQLNQSKVLQFTDHLRKILKHEINMAELKNNKEGDQELIHVRKLAEHYFHHLLVMAKVREAKKVIHMLRKILRKNHAALLKLHKTVGMFWKQEQDLIQKTVKKHYLFAGFLLAIALYFAWTTFWGLTDFVLEQWVYSEFNAETLASLIQQAMLLLFSISFIWAFARYQSGGGVVKEETTS